MWLDASHRAVTRCRRVQVVDRLTHSRSRGFGFITFDAVEVRVRGGAQAANPCRAVSEHAMSWEPMSLWRL